MAKNTGVNKLSPEDRDLLIRLSVQMEQIIGDMHKLRNDLSTNYVTRNEFTPVRNIVFGLVGAILMGLIGAFTSFVIRGGISP